MITYVVDFDDLCDTVADRSLYLLQQVKARHPNFKVTLFTIPDRTSPETVAKFKAHDWIALAPHGWRHTRGECLAWAAYEAEAKLKAAQEKGIDAPAFRAPAWVISRPIYEVCRDLGITVCDHKDEYLSIPGTRVYRYNDPAHRRPKIRPIHGHLTQCRVDNFIGDMAGDGRLHFADKCEFLYPWEANVIEQESA